MRISEWSSDVCSSDLDWRGEQKHLHVISMPVDMLYFNPDTHRVRAQRTLDPERNRVLEQEPWSEPAQEYLHYLLSSSPSNPNRSEEHRVGKEWVRTGRSRW